jgi:thiamine biosynthesis lipoprotein
MCSVDVQDCALASSAGRFDPTRSYAVSSPAIIDPATGRPACAILGATVCAASCMLADALTKVVMIAGETAIDLLARHKASALAVLKSGEIRVTPDWHHAVRLAA